MKTSINVRWTGNMAFETEVAGHKIVMDADLESGGEDTGVRPKPLQLVALGGCTGMDVVSLLKKMRVDIDDFQMIIEGYKSSQSNFSIEKFCSYFYNIK